MAQVEEAYCLQRTRQLPSEMQDAYNTEGQVTDCYLWIGSHTKIEIVAKKYCD